MGMTADERAEAIFRREQERMREAYRLQPDSAQEACPWDLPEEWKVEAV